MIGRLNRYRKQAARRESGFTLVEQIVTLAILGMVLTAAMAALATGGLGLNVATSRNEAMNLAQAQMECIKNQDFDDTGASPYRTCSATIVPPSGYLVEFDVKPDPLDPFLQRIEVTVQRGSNEILILEGRKVKRRG